MTFHGQSVIALVWGVVSTESPRGVTNPRAPLGARLLRRAATEALRVVSRRAGQNPSLGQSKTR